MTCMAGRSLDAVLVAVRDQGQEARALDGGVELALVDRAGAGQAGGRDLAVFGDEVAQGVDVLVVDFLDAGDGEAAEALALEQQRLRVALRTLVLVEFLESGHVVLFTNLERISGCGAPGACRHAPLRGTRRTATACPSSGPRGLRPLRRKPPP